MRTQTLDAFQVIADPSRRQILNMLTKDSMTINSLADNFDMSRPAVSKHIKILYGAGFISIENVGRERFCTLKEDGFNEIHEWLNFYNNF
jgi:DNA-binding transcriptional ArsR family regulator